MSLKDDIFKDTMGSYSISNSFERWKEYRTRITEYIIKYTQQGKSIAILGAGESNDIDLDRLYKHMGNLTLVDKNMNAMKIALNKYNLSNVADVKVVSADFFGITDDEYKECIDIFCQDMKRKKDMFSPMGIIPKYIKKMEELYNRINETEIDLGIDNHDYIVAIGIHSQINSLLERFWLDMIRATKSIDNEQISRKIHEENDIFIPRLNNAIMKKTNERAFIGLEFLEIERNCCVEGATQAIDDLSTKIPEQKGLVYQDIWPLKEGVDYAMQIYNIEKKYYGF